MRFIPMLISSVAATGAMTLYSYWYSRKKKKQFREPQLLGKLMHPQGARKEIGTVWKALGWISHFGVGLFITLLYWKYWKTFNVRPGVMHGILLGGATGILASRVWKLTFTLHPFPPRIDYKKYYIQLIEAHVFFGLISVLAYRLYKEEHPEVLVYLPPAQRLPAGEGKRQLTRIKPVRTIAD